MRRERAQSEWRLVATASVNFSHYQQKFHSGYDEKQKKILSGVPDGPLGEVGRHSASAARRLPSCRTIRVFDDVVFNAETVAHRLRELAYLNRGVKIVLRPDERTREEPEKRNAGVPLRRQAFPITSPI